MNASVAIQVLPTLPDKELVPVVDKVIEYIQSQGLKTVVSPFETTIEGEYDKLMEKIAQRGMETEGMEHYLSAFKYGMPPHGGLGIGMERLTMQLIGEDNVREATLFPRDLSRLEP